MSVSAKPLLRDISRPNKNICKDKFCRSWEGFVGKQREEMRYQSVEGSSIRVRVQFQQGFIGNRWVLLYLYQQEQGTMLGPRYDPNTASKLYNSTVSDTRKPSSSIHQKRNSQLEPSIPFSSNYLTPNYSSGRTLPNKDDPMLRVTVSTVDQPEQLLNKTQKEFLSKSQVYTTPLSSRSSQKYEGYPSDRGTNTQRLSHQLAGEGGENNKQKPTATSDNIDNYSKLIEKLNKKEKIIKELQRLCETKVSDNIRSHAYEKDTVQLCSPVRPRRYTGIKNTGTNNQQEPRNTLEAPGGFKIDLTKSTNYDTNEPRSSRQQKQQYLPIRKGSDFIPTKTNLEGELLSKEFKLITTSSYNTPKDSKDIHEQISLKERSNSKGVKASSKRQILSTNNFYPKDYTFYSNINLPDLSFDHQASSPARKRQDKDYNSKEHKYLHDVRRVLETRNVKNTSEYFSNRQVSIYDFELKKNLGEGKFGVVYQALHKQTRSLYALKKISKKVIKSNLMVDQLLQEIKIQSFCNHENILKVYGSFDDSEHVYLILEYMEQGTLFSQLKMKKTLSEEEAATKLKDIVSAVTYLHQNGIAHRDIKPENIVVSNGVAKLCDFGWAAICTDRRKTYCGTFDYVAPQILEGSEYDATVDLWCLGVLAYELLVGKAPFYHISRKETMKKIMNVQKLQYPSCVSVEAISFIEGLLKKNPEERMYGSDILKHAFLKKATDSAV